MLATSPPCKRACACACAGEQIHARTHSLRLGLMIRTPDSLSQKPGGPRRSPDQPNDKTLSSWWTLVSSSLLTQSVAKSGLGPTSFRPGRSSRQVASGFASLQLAPGPPAHFSVNTVSARPGRWGKKSPARPLPASVHSVQRGACVRGRCSLI